MITPATPVRVKERHEGPAIMSVEENTGGPTSRAAAAMRSKPSLRAGQSCGRCSPIMITDESTTMPKSTAPSENEIGLGSRRYHAEECEEQGQWQVECDQQGGAQLAQKSHNTNETSTMPVTRFSITVCVVSLTRSARSRHSRSRRLLRAEPGSTPGMDHRTLYDRARPVKLTTHTVMENLVTAGAGLVGVVAFSGQAARRLAGRTHPATGLLFAFFGMVSTEPRPISSRWARWTSASWSTRR